ncbi:MAG: ABC transporter permease [Cyclobacteriaceae bacterium]
MILHYLKVALRNISRFRVYSSINVLGLVIGFSCFLLISLYVIHEYSYDQYHLKGDRIYRLALGDIEANRMGSSISAGAMPLTLKESYSGIEEVVRLRHLPSLVQYEDKAVFEGKFFFTDSTFFKVFSNRLLIGNPNTALLNSYSVVITPETALRYFGTSGEEVVGKLLQIDESMTFVVTGMIEAAPTNAHFHFDFLASASSLLTHPQEHVRTYQLENWYSHYFHNYLLLEEGADPIVVDQNIRNAAKKYSDPVYYERFGTNMGLFLQPLFDIHLNPLRGELEEQGDSTILKVLSGIALLIMALGCINYMNITTAQSTYRVVEVGIRKTMGASKWQMALQFLGESFSLNFFAMFLAIGFVDLMLPYFNTLVGKQISFFNITGPVILGLLLVVLVSGLLGGLYPAIILGNYSPVKSLKKFVVLSPGKLGIRRLVVAFQFMASMILVSGTFIIFSQVKYMLNKDLGLSTEKVIVIPTHGDPLVNSKVDSFFERISGRSEIANFTISELSPGDPIFGIVASFDGGEVRDYPTTGIDYGFLDTYKIKLLSGRNFSKDYALDTLERIIINETLAKSLGWTAQEAIGKRYDMEGDGEIFGEVIGVTEDFNFNSLRNQIQPLVMGIMPYFFQKVSVRLSGTIVESIDVVRDAWSATYPTRPFDFRFADANINQLYQREKKFGKLFMIFALVAFSIGLLGLFGITSMELKFRTKEIGIRKVLGAPIVRLLAALSGDFFRLTVSAFLISLPVAYYLMDQWLQNFSYRIHSLLGLIVWPGLLVVALASIVVLLKTYFASVANPVDTLRNE